MQRPLVAIEALLNEGQQDGIELIRASEERADMTVALQWRPSESNLSQYLCHRPSLPPSYRAQSHSSTPGFAKETALQPGRFKRIGLRMTPPEIAERFSRLVTSASARCA